MSEQLAMCFLVRNNRVDVLKVLMRVRPCFLRPCCPSHHHAGGMLPLPTQAPRGEWFKRISYFLRVGEGASNALLRTLLFGWRGSDNAKRLASAQYLRTSPPPPPRSPAA